MNAITLDHGSIESSTHRVFDTFHVQIAVVGLTEAPDDGSVAPGVGLPPSLGVLPAPRLVPPPHARPELVVNAAPVQLCQGVS